MKRVISFFITIVLLSCVVIPGVNVSAVDDIKTGTLVTFGSYPQSKVTDESLITALNSQTFNWIYYDYYCDGKQENYMMENTSKLTKETEQCKNDEEKYNTTL